MLQLLAGSLVQVRSELGECSQFTVLSQSGTDTTGQLLDDLGLGGTTNTGYRTPALTAGRMPELNMADSRKI